jgi:hypothetical protein
LLAALAPLAPHASYRGLGRLLAVALADGAWPRQLPNGPARAVGAAAARRMCEVARQQWSARRAGVEAWAARRAAAGSTGAPIHSEPSAAALSASAAAGQADSPHHKHAAAARQGHPPAAVPWVAAAGPNGSLLVLEQQGAGSSRCIARR